MAISYMDLEQAPLEKAMSVITAAVCIRIVNTIWYDRVKEFKFLGDPK